MLKKIIYIQIFILLLFQVTSSVRAEEKISSKFNWQKIEAGLEFSKYTLGPGGALLRSEVVLLKIDPRKFFLDLAISYSADQIKNFCEFENAIAGINANFFDPKNKPLGLLIKDNKLIQGLHRQGNVLTGVFSMEADLPKIENRSDFNPSNKQLALQAGPRLIENGQVLRLTSPEVTSRRSGIAITNKNEVIIYATSLRFPGASLLEIQHMLILPELDVKDALNLDGGGSSQFYLEKTGTLSEEILLSGGDDVPVALVVKRKK